nr:VCBS repeat-containing protein [Geodermatophilaceae bacterium]
ALGDVDADGDLDQVVTFEEDPSFGLMLNNGMGRFGAPISYPLAGANGVVAVADLDGDGADDVVVAAQFDRAISVLRGTAGGVLQGPQRYRIPRYADDLAIADMNGDGRLDVVAASRASGGRLYVLLGQTGGRLGSAQITTVDLAPSRLAVGDVTGDGIPDAVTAGLSDYVNLAPGRGDGTFGPETTVLVEIGVFEVALFDMDRDGRLDLVAGKNGDIGRATLLVLRGDGAGGFVQVSRQTPAETSAFVRELAIADLNGDGLLDVSVATQAFSVDGGVNVLYGTGGGRLSTASVLVGDGDTFALTAGDVDGDGDVDLATAFSAQSSTRVLVNLGTRP